MTAVALAPQLLAAQMAPEGAAGALVRIDALVEGFVADTGQALYLEEAGDLLRAPLQGELGLGEGPGGRIDAAGVGCGPHAGHSQALRLLGPVAALPAVAGELPADGGFVAVHQGGDGTRVMAGFLEDVDLVSFVMGEMCVVHSGLL